MCMLFFEHWKKYEHRPDIKDCQSDKKYFFILEKYACLLLIVKTEWIQNGGVITKLRLLRNDGNKTTNWQKNECYKKSEIMKNNNPRN